MQRQLITQGLAFVAALACSSLSLCAQISPEDAVRQILESIDDELSEIEKQLLETSKRNSVGKDGSTEQVQKLLEETQGSQGRVVRGIDQLIDELQKMQQQQQGGGGGQSQQQDQQRSQDPLEDQERTQRQEIQQDAGQRQDQPQQGQQQGQQQQQQQGQQQSQQPQDGSQANDNKEDRPPQGGNTKSGSQAQEGEERSVRESDRARWGQLQKYDIHTHQKGSLPEVPEKYRRLLEEFQRNGQRSGSNRRQRR